MAEVRAPGLRAGGTSPAVHRDMRLTAAILLVLSATAEARPDDPAIVIWIEDGEADEPTREASTAELPDDTAEPTGPGRVGPVPRLAAVRARRAPAIDGDLDDDVWRRAPIGAGFTAAEPRPGASRYTTEVRLAYDAEHLYVAVAAHDPEPERIRALITRRDQDAPSDWIRIAVDVRGDRRSAYELGVSAANIQTDTRWSADGESDPAWNAVWSSATGRDDDGWRLEVAVPWRELRFAPGRDAIGLQVTRVVPRDRERSHWSEVPVNAANPLLHLGEAAVTTPRSTRSLDLIPFALVRSDRPARRAVAAGADGRWVLGGDAVLDVTVLPDFGLLDADPTELDLGAVEPFLTERRSFFLSEAELFDVTIESDDATDRLVHTRRIGRAVEDEVAPVIAAGKLTARTSGGLSIGALEAVTAEPWTSFTAAALRQERGDGQGALRAVATAVVRDGPAADALELPRAATAVAIDGERTRSSGELGMWLTLITTHVTGSTAAMTALQSADGRALDRPDATHVELDATRRALTGWGGELSAGKVGGDPWQGGVQLTTRSPTLVLDDLGYAPVVDRIHAGAWAALVDPGGGWHEGARLGLGASGGWTFGGEPVSRLLRVDGTLDAAGWSAAASITVAHERLDVTALRGGPALRTAPGRLVAVSLSTPGERGVTAEVHGACGWDVEGGHACSLGPRVTARIGTRLTVEGSGELEHRRVLDHQPDELAGTLEVATLDERAASGKARLAFAFTSTLAVDGFARAYRGSGAWTSRRMVQDPRAVGRGQRFVAVTAGAPAPVELVAHAAGAVTTWSWRPGASWSLGWTYNEGEHVAMTKIAVRWSP